MTEVLEGQIGLFGPDTQFGKTCQDPCLRGSQKAQISKRSSPNSSASSAKKPPLFLFLRTVGPTQDASAEWVTPSFPFPSLGDYMTHSFGDRPSTLMAECGYEELPNGVSVSRLSQTLQDSVPERFSLSAKACEGILRRASTRGKELPSELKEALERQALSGAEIQPKDFQNDSEVCDP